MPLRRPYPLRQTWLRDLTERCLDPQFVRAVQRGTRESFEEMIRRPHAGIVEFALFSTDYMNAVRHEIHLFEHWCRAEGASPLRPNSMNSYGVVLAELGLEAAMDELLDTWISPLAAWALPQHEGASLDHQHSFVVEYAEGGDTDLGFHVDDSEITLNACLGSAFEGAEVYFRGARCDEHRDDSASPEEMWQWQPSPGRAILHAGAHRHGVHPLRKGKRVNVIVWARSSRHRKKHRAPHEGPVAWCPGCKLRTEAQVKGLEGSA